MLDANAQAMMNDAAKDLGLAVYIKDGLAKKKRKPYPELSVDEMSKAKEKLKAQYCDRSIFDLFCSSTLRRFMVARWAFEQPEGEMLDLKAVLRLLMRMANLKFALVRALTRPATAPPLTRRSPAPRDAPHRPLGALTPCHSRLGAPRAC